MLYAVVFFVLAAQLLARGVATSPAEAVRQVRAVRPGVRLKPNQRRFLEALACR